MISIHTILTIAKYETRTLLRSWFFRIFAGLAVISIGIFNIAAFLPSSGAPFIYRAIPGAIPYANLIILNLGQAIVAVFLASEFLKQDSKNDTIEVIYARSMTNSEYIIGKSIGIISLFLLLNIVLLVMGMGFSFLSNDSSQAIGELLYYPFLISIPTLVFILGLAFFLMILLKNQAITFIVLLGYIALTIFYLNDKYYHLFDYIAYQIPMMNSTIGGFGNLHEVIIHRAIYFFFGIGLIFFTIYKLNRLPQSKKLVSLPLYLGVITIGAGAYLCKSYIDLKVGSQDFKNELISLNDKYISYPKVNISSCDLNLTHLEDEIEAESTLTIQNSSSSEIDTIILSLNPNLKVKALQLNGKTVAYQRDLQIIKITPPQSLQTNQTATVNISYKGSIDERTHFLDQDPELFEDNFAAEIFRIRKRFSYLQENFVCLTKESLWYPIADIGYSSTNPVLRTQDFTNFNLNVKVSNGMIPISQGEKLKIDETSFNFKPEKPLTQISLLIGNYEQYSIQVDSIEYSIYSKENNQYFLQHFTELQDSLPTLIREMKNEFETKIGLEYPFKRFILAEVPVQFALDKHIWSISSDAVQPEIIFYPEKGVVMEETDFKRRKKRFEKRMKRDNEEITEEELQARMFKRFVRGNLNPPETEWYQFDHVDRNTYSPFPNYYEYTSRMISREYPALDIALANYLKERNSSKQYHSRWQFDGISKEERINLEFKRAPLKELIKTGIPQSKKDDEQISLNDIFKAKGNHLFSLLKGNLGDEKFNSFLLDFIKSKQFKTFSFSEFDQALQAKFGISITQDVKSWYEEKKLPGFLFKDIETYKVKEGDHIKYQIRFKVSNPEPTGGIISIQVQLEDNTGRRRRSFRSFGEAKGPDFSKVIYLPAKSAREVGFVFSKQPSRMNINTHISENLPNNLSYNFDSFDKLKKGKFFNDIKPIDTFNEIVSENEFIVDNEDKGFQYHQLSNKSYLKQWMDSKRENTHEYSRLRTWNPPNEWKNVLRSGFYGKYVRSAYFTKAGQGDRTAVWKADLNEGAYYDIYCHIKKEQYYGRRRRNARKTDYNFKIYHEGGVENVHKTDQELEEGWNFLGTYFVTPDSAKVELSNKSTGKFLFADAIKWIKND